MIPLVEQHRSELDDLCRRFHVQRLELFGSAVAEQRFNPDRSDLDFLVEFQPLEPGESAHSYFGLLIALEDLFNKQIDLVMPRAIRNRYFLEEVNETRIPLYDA
ncbi:MAG: nucleotidyltransferase domain-containing protein [Planctomycetales bacterium]|nr:nucleotidyltransferase domain-containing protein [Planctomycetales bacterium]